MVPENARELIAALATSPRMMNEGLADAVPMWLLNLALIGLSASEAAGEAVTEGLAWTAYMAFNHADPVDKGFLPAIRAALLAIAPALIARGRAMGLEEAASAAYTTPEYVAGWNSDGAMIPGSPYDRGRFDAAAAIRALGRPA